jgi:PAS domain S-box-containing protein
MLDAFDDLDRLIFQLSRIRINVMIEQNVLTHGIDGLGPHRMSHVFNEVLGTLPDLAFYELSVTGEVCGWSEAASRLLGFSSDEVIGRHLHDLAEKAVSSAPLSALEEAAQRGRSETFGLVVRKDGSRFWANEVTVPVQDKTGVTVGYARVVRDVTTWKAAQQERDRFFMLSVDLVCVCGFDGYFKTVNPSFTRVLGFTEAELLSQPYLDFVHPDDRMSTAEEADENSRGQGDAITLTFKNRYRCADGSYRWLEWKSNSVVADRLIYAVARDVTEQMAVEQKLAEYAKELERSNLDLQQFAYVASHDLQEPLRAVVGCVQMLSERNAGKLDERSVELMGHATDGAKRMQTLINDLLAYSRAGSKGISKGMIDSRSCVEKALRQLTFAINESQAVVKVDDLPQVWADPVQLTQLFQNLIGNAIKFRAGPKPEVHVHAAAADGQTTFSIADNGIGIPPEYQSRLFGLFQRLNSRRQYPGTGIGLAICKRIVERHGGRIWFESVPGGGAVFRFSLSDGKSP